MRTFTHSDHARMLAACADHRSTEEEREFLSLMASNYGAAVSVSDAEYWRASRLAAIHIHVEDSIFDRPAASIYTLNDGSLCV